ncbi:MAG: AraC family transcriptional regulator [Paludibacteraceae bacterium]|nr:AraC family transcriptional regulator [Paludibacteraceae bacterium]
MQFEIIQPTEALRPYITRYVFVRAEGSTDTMAPPADDPRFVNGKHVQPLLPNYGSLVFMRNVLADFNGVQADGLTLLGANQKTIGLTTLKGWFEGMLLDFEPGGMYALLHIDLQQLAGKVLTAAAYGDEGLLQLDSIFKQFESAPEITRLIDAFFLGHLPHKEDLNYSRLRKVIAACDEAKGNISAAQMARVACLGERQFLRVFKTYVGIPPKQFIRLRRFHRTIQQMQQSAHTGKPIDLLSIALTHGYYDLSHMALEFQQMGCVSPSHFRALGIPLSDDFSIFFA